VFLPGEEAKYFCGEGWTGESTECPVGQISPFFSPRPACGERSKPKRSAGFGWGGAAAIAVEDFQIEIAENPPHPALRADLSPQAGRGDRGTSVGTRRTGLNGDLVPLAKGRPRPVLERQPIKPERNRDAADEGGIILADQYRRCRFFRSELATNSASTKSIVGKLNFACG
jgi:hypothetical protein